MTKKRIRINWGTGIAIFIAIFIIAMGTLFWLSSRVEFDMVTDNYYREGLNYQDDIDRVQNLAALGQYPEILITEDSLIMTLPPFFDKKQLVGNIWVYRPSNAQFDLRDTLIAARWVTSLEKMIPGKYNISLVWICDETPYSYKENIVLEDSLFNR